MTRSLIMLLILFGWIYYFKGIPAKYDYNPKYYWPQDVTVNETGSRYKGVNWPKYPFFIGTVETTTREPRFGYPLHGRVQIGVSDTLEVFIKLRNQTGSSYVLGTGDDPADWFVPVLYNPMSDVKVEKPIADTSDFDYNFKYWWWDIEKVSAPTVIDTTGGWRENPKNSDLTMEYYVWGIPPGTYRLIMDTTSAAPAGFRVMNGWDIELIEIRTPKSAADTINAWVACFWRAANLQDSIAAEAWVDTILSYYPKSIAGWRLRAELNGIGLEADTLYAMQALDSVQKFIEYYEDPALPDSANLNTVQKRWLNMVNLGAAYFQEFRRTFTGEFSPFEE